jgi:hypothetical protein
VNYNHHNAIGYIFKLEGKLATLTPEGKRKTLHVGDNLYEGQHVLPFASSKAVVMLRNGEIHTIEPVEPLQLSIEKIRHFEQQTAHITPPSRFSYLEVSTPLDSFDPLLSAIETTNQMDEAIKRLNQKVVNKRAPSLDENDLIHLGVISSDTEYPPHLLHQLNTTISNSHALNAHNSINNLQKIVDAIDNLQEGILLEEDLSTLGITLPSSVTTDTINDVLHMRLAPAVSPNEIENIATALDKVHQKATTLLSEDLLLNDLLTLGIKGEYSDTLLQTLNYELPIMGSSVVNNIFALQDIYHAIQPIPLEPTEPLSQTVTLPSMHNLPMQELLNHENDETFIFKPSTDEPTPNHVPSLEHEPFVPIQQEVPSPLDDDNDLILITGY